MLARTKRRTLASLVLAFSAHVVCAQSPPAADHHAHLQSPTAARLLNQGAVAYPGEDDTPEEEKPATAAELIAALDAAGIRRSVALSDAYRLGSPFVHVPEERAAVDAENDWTLQQIRPYAQRLVGFCSVNPTRPYALAVIQHCAKIGLRGGLKLHLANANFRFDDPAQVRALRNAFAAANRLRMPILLHLRADRDWDAAHNVRIFLNQVLPAAPNVPVQLAHLCGWAGYDRTGDLILSTFAETCTLHPGRCRRLYFDLSAVILPPPDADPPPGSDLKALLKMQESFPEGPDKLAANLRRIGLDRILFATDWPEITATSYIPLLRTHLHLTAAELNQIFSNLAPYFQ